MLPLLPKPLPNRLKHERITNSKAAAVSPVFACVCCHQNPWKQILSAELVCGSSPVLLQPLQLWDAQAGGTWAPPAIPAEPGEAQTAIHTDLLNLLILKILKTPLSMMQCSFDVPHSRFCFLPLPNATLELKLGLRSVFYTSAPVQGDPGEILGIQPGQCAQVTPHAPSGSANLDLQFFCLQLSLSHS